MWIPIDGRKIFGKEAWEKALDETVSVTGEIIPTMDTVFVFAIKNMVLNLNELENRIKELEQKEATKPLF